MLHPQYPTHPRLFNLSHTCETTDGRVPFASRVYLLNVVAYEISTSNHFSDLASKRPISTPPPLTNMSR